MSAPSFPSVPVGESNDAASAHLVLGAAAADGPEAARRSPSARRRGLTVEQLAERQRSRVVDMRWLLEDSARLGLVECDPVGRWQLTPDTELRFGRALRDFSAPNELEGP